MSRGVRVVILLVAGVHPAWAALAGKAASAMRSADRHTRACDIARALVKYRLVYDRTKHADALLKMAAAQRLIGKRVAAAKNYERYLAHTGADPAKKPEVDEILKEIDREVGRLRVQTGGKGRVFVDGSDEGEGAEVKVRVDPGRHGITLQSGGTIHGAAVVRVGAGDVRVVRFGEDPTPPVPKPEPETERTATGDVAKQADRLKKACELLEAIDKYRAAQARSPNPKVARRLADALERAGRPSQAADAYDESARLKPSRAARVQRRLRKLRTQFDRVSVAPRAEGARLLVDGNQVSPTKTGTVRVDPGRHAALLEEGGRIQAAAIFTAVAGGQTNVTLQRIGASSAPTAASGGAAAGLGSGSGPSPDVSASTGGLTSGGGVADPPIDSAPSWATDGERGGESGAQDSTSPDEDAEATAARRFIPEEHAGHAGQLSLLLHADTDLRTGDVGPTAGIAFGIGSRIEVSTVALAQRLSGARIAAALFLLPEPALKPFVRAGLPIFSEDGLQAGIHAGMGLVWDFTPITGLSADFSVEHFPTMPKPFFETYAVASVGVQVRTP